MDALKSTHTTKEGAVILIAAMETMHLLYTVRLMFRRLGDLIPSPNQTETDKYKNALYGSPEITPERAADATNELMYQVYPYLTEVLFRVNEIQALPKALEVLDEIHSLMKVVFARDSRLIGFNAELGIFGRRQLSLASNNDDEEDYFDERDPEEGDR